MRATKLRPSALQLASSAPVECGVEVWREVAQGLRRVPVRELVEQLLGNDAGLQSRRPVGLPLLDRGDQPCIGGRVDRRAQPRCCRGFATRAARRAASSSTVTSCLGPRRRETLRKEAVCPMATTARRRRGGPGEAPGVPLPARSRPGGTRAGRGPARTEAGLLRPPDASETATPRGRSPLSRWAATRGRKGAAKEGAEACGRRLAAPVRAATPARRPQPRTGRSTAGGRELVAGSQDRFVPAA